MEGSAEGASSEAESVNIKGPRRATLERGGDFVSGQRGLRGAELWCWAVGQARLGLSVPKEASGVRVREGSGPSAELCFAHVLAQG